MPLSNYTPDKWYASQRIWAVVLMLVAFILGLLGFNFSEGLQEQAAEFIITMAIPFITGALALISKVRESKKGRPE